MQRVSDVALDGIRIVFRPTHEVGLNVQCFLADSFKFAALAVELEAVEVIEVKSRVLV